MLIKGRNDAGVRSQSLDLNVYGALISSSTRVLATSMKCKYINLYARVYVFVCTRLGLHVWTHLSVCVFVWGRAIVCVFMRVCC